MYAEINKRLPLLYSQKSIQNRNSYLEWVITYKFANSKSALSAYDILPHIKQTLIQFNIPIVDYYVNFLEDLFIEIYCEPLVENRKTFYTISPNYVKLGTYALAFYKKDSDWTDINNLSAYLDTFVRCLFYELKRTSEVKNYFKNQIHL